MRRLINPVFFALAVTVGSAAPGPAAEGLEIHEWGTFTTVSGADGTLLTGLEREEHALPAFVHSHAGFSPANKGWNRPVANVTVKMETPVIYFYAPHPLQVTVEVGFRGGSISQWYPDRVRGEVLPEPASRAGGRESVNRDMIPVDFAQGYEGSAAWTVEVLAPEATDPITAPRAWETPQWPRARVAAANKVRGPKGEVEGFIFYRGIGRLTLPLEVTAGRDGRIQLRNTGRDRLPFLLVYEKVAGVPVGRIWWMGELAADGRQIVRADHAGGPTAVANAAGGLRPFADALETAGLSPAEATAMLSTWRESYFDREGLRVFWIVPRAFLDAVLPLTVAPRPTRMARVLVGRSEILTPEFESRLQQDFKRDGGTAWENDRYFAAYRERVRQLGVVSRAVVP